MLSYSAAKTLKRLAKEYGFIQRGRAYFRVIGDGVLQVLKFEYERVFSHYALYVGVFSLYGELERQWFTSAGCIPKYPVVNFAGKRSTVTMTEKDGMTYFEVISPEDQLEILRSKVIGTLNKTTTQDKLADLMCQLDIVACGELYWCDFEKFAPFLCAGRYNDAAKLVNTIIAQNLDALRSKRHNLSDYDFQIEQERTEKCIALLEKQLTLAQTADETAIKAYLYDNLQRNLKLAGFCL